MPKRTDNESAASYADTVVPLADLLEFIEGAEHYCPTCPEELDTYIDAQGLREFLRKVDGEACR